MQHSYTDLGANRAHKFETDNFSHICPPPLPDAYHISSRHASNCHTNFLITFDDNGNKNLSSLRLVFVMVHESYNRYRVSFSIGQSVNRSDIFEPYLIDSV